MIRVKRNYCAISPIDDPDTTPGGIIIPDEAKDRTDQGIVKYVGPECVFVQPLDYVIYGGWNGQLLNTEDDGRLIIVSEEFITARVHHEDIDSVEIPNVYYKGRDGYFTATYETLIPLLAKAISKSPIIQDKTRWDVREVSQKSKPNQYRVMADSRD